MSAAETTTIGAPKPSCQSLSSWYPYPRNMQCIPVYARRIARICGLRVPRSPSPGPRYASSLRLRVVFWEHGSASLRHKALATSRRQPNGSGLRWSAMVTLGTRSSLRGQHLVSLLLCLRGRAIHTRVQRSACRRPPSTLSSSLRGRPYSVFLRSTGNLVRITGSTPSTSSRWPRTQHVVA
ncbi:hypothetical protein K466DRAFT_72462 [Polyporus arcularius HHB13444]|uniref:Uncharacterized protein n=1 Tax=Polyporus arcularius HHB13444 TaxID=1314778 RepID=A0A5C3Q5Q5_9APHY|nr:hypothetical protein K466DRAFT_72462 [Polyporus arcularius HHB13444]